MLVLLLDIDKCVVDNLEDIRLLGVLHNVRPAALGRKIEDILGSIELHLVNILFQTLRYEFLQPLLEAVTCILEEDEAQNHVLVFCRLDSPTQLVGRLPQGSLHTL